MHLGVKIGLVSAVAGNPGDRQIAVEVTAYDVDSNAIVDRDTLWFSEAGLGTDLELASLAVQQAAQAWLDSRPKDIFEEMKPLVDVIANLDVRSQPVT